MSPERSDINPLHEGSSSASGPIASRTTPPDRPDRRSHAVGSSSISNRACTICAQTSPSELWWLGEAWRRRVYPGVFAVRRGFFNRSLRCSRKNRYPNNEHKEANGCKCRQDSCNSFSNEHFLIPCTSRLCPGSSADVLAPNAQALRRFLPAPSILRMVLAGERRHLRRLCCLDPVFKRAGSRCGQPIHNGQWPERRNPRSRAPAGPI